MGQDVANGEPPHKDDLMKTIGRGLSRGMISLSTSVGLNGPKLRTKQSKSLEPDEVPNYITRLLPWLFDEFTGCEEDNYALKLSKFEDIFLILNILLSLPIE